MNFPTHNATDNSHSLGYLSYGPDYVEPERQANSDGDHDDGAAEGPSNLAARLKPAHAGYIDIQQNQIRVLADNHFDGFLPVLRQYDVVAVTRKRACKTRRICGSSSRGWLCCPQLYRPTLAQRGRERRTCSSEHSVRNVRKEQLRAPERIVGSS